MWTRMWTRWSVCEPVIIDLYNPPPHHIKLYNAPPMWTRWSVFELVIRPSLYVCVVLSRDQ